MSERIELTESDRKFLEHAVSCLKAPLEVDLAKIATRLGIKPKSASNKWAEVKKKIMHNSSLDDADVPPTSPATDAGAGDGEDDELAGAATPAKKRKRAAASATPKTPRKPRTPRKPKKEPEVKDEEPENDVKDEEEGDVKGEEGDEVAGEA